MKICSKCQVEKPLSDFSTRKTSGKCLAECKKCVCVRSNKHYQDNKEKCNEKRKKYYIENREKTLEQSKKYYYENYDRIRKRANEQNRTPERRAKSNERGKLWAKQNKEKHIQNATKHRKKHPEKHEARQQIYWAVKLGFMKKSETCEECKMMINTNAHHDDYNKPLVVRWLCKQCHSDWHRNNRK